MSIPVHLPTVPSPADQTFPWPCSVVTAAPSPYGTTHHPRTGQTTAPSRQTGSQTRSKAGPDSARATQVCIACPSTTTLLFTPSSPHFTSLFFISLVYIVILSSRQIFLLTFLKHQKNQEKLIISAVDVWITVKIDNKTKFWQESRRRESNKGERCK